MISSLPEGYNLEIWLIIPSPYIIGLQSTHCHTIVQILSIVVYKNKVEVTVNTCTCTDVFTIITGGQGFMAVVNKTSSSGYALGLGPFTAINP